MGGAAGRGRRETVLWAGRVGWGLSGGTDILGLVVVGLALLAKGEAGAGRKR